MRLGQLARFLHTNISEITTFLESQSITVGQHPNSKLTEEHEAMVIQHFGGTQESEEIVDKEPQVVADDLPQEPVVAEIEPEELTTEDIEEATVPQEPTATPHPAVMEGLDEEEIGHAMMQAMSGAEVIKAQKVALQGLKVLGKIELPEKKVKEADDTETSESGQEPKRTAKRQRLSDEEREKRRIKAKKMREKQAEQKQLREKEKALKQIKKKKESHYKQKVDKVAPKKTAKKSAKQIRKEIAKKEAEMAPRTWLGKFWRWLNT